VRTMAERKPRFHTFKLVEEPIEVNGMTVQVRTNDGSRYPSSCVYECLTCQERIKYCHGLHRYCAPCYLESVATSHAKEKAHV
jgi:hypothetical protein